MIYTVTFNPALDYTLAMKGLVPGRVNRTESEQIFPGGKGLNVSIMLRHLGVESVTLGFTAGFTGHEIQRLVRAAGCTTDFLELPTGNSRINVKIKSTEETDINGQGPAIPLESLEQLQKKLNQLVAGDTLVLAGSIPSTLPPDIYEQLLARLSGRQVRFVVDATGELLRSVLKYHPFLIKPNHHELGELFGEELSNSGEILERARELQAQGARNVLVSMAGDGAILLDEAGGVHQARPPKGTVINSVGAGDSMVAGFLAGYLESSGDYGHAFRMGLCAGSASAFQEWLAGRGEVESLLAQLGR